VRQSAALRARPTRGSVLGMISELDFAPRISGRAQRPLTAESVRDLRESDLALLSSERGTRAPPIQKLRDRHHSLARALASGMRDHEASAITGYSASRISILKADPTFQELLAGYQSQSDTVFADFVTRASGLAVEAVKELHDRLEEDPESFTHGQLLEVVKTVADRSGNAPVQRSVSVGVNVDLGDRLAAARRRLQSLDSPGTGGRSPMAPNLIEGEFALSETPHGVES
jgi:hypothetical protein